MRFSILGSVEVQVDGRALEIERPRCRAVLAYLVLAGNRMVTTERLIDALWGGAAPSTARAQIQADVSTIRRTLRRGGAEPIASRPTGYVLQLAPGESDYGDFTELVAQARATENLTDQARALREALDLWRGPALADLHVAYTDAARAALEEERLGAYEQLVDVELALGRHLEVTADLITMVATHPLRERVRAQLMLALYRGGRQADALAVARDLRALLAEEHGLDPAKEVAELEQRILRADPSLDAPPFPPLAAGPAPTGGQVPAQLPPAVPNFAGRTDQLKQLDEAAPAERGATSVPVVAVTGSAGVGKTALAVHWGHAVRQRFPDGQLYVNLRGYGPGAALSPVDALARFLRALGVEPERVPTDLEEATALYRSRLSDRRVLILLDNAHSAEQVRPLLPASAGCCALITSRDPLSGLVALDGAQRVLLDSLPAVEATDLLAMVLGRERVELERQAAAELAALCAYLPLALRIAATQLAGRPDQSLTAFVEQFGSGNRLAALAVDGDSQAAVRVAFDGSFTVLSPAARQLFALLGLVPGTDVSVEAAASLADAEPAAVAVRLGELARSSLVETRGPGRFGFHDLLRLYAAEHAQTDLSATERQAASARLYRHYLSTVENAAELLYPTILRLPHADEGPQPSWVVRPASDVEASAWLDAERTNLTATITHTAANGPREVAWRLADALRGFFILRMHTVDALRAAETALQAARAENNPAAQAAAHLGFSTTLWRQARLAEASEHLNQAIELSREAGWAVAQAASLGNLGAVYVVSGDLERAADLYVQALAVNRQTGTVGGQAVNLGNLGAVLSELGRPQEALEQHRQAIELYRSIGSRSGEALSHGNLAEAYHTLGRFQESLEHLGVGLALQREIGDRPNQVEMLYYIAAVHRDLGEYATARPHADEALALAREVGHRRLEAKGLNVSGSIANAVGERAQAQAQFEAAHKLASGGGNRYAETEALLGQSECHRQAGHLTEAISFGRDAVALARSGHYRVLAAYAQLTLSAALLAAGDVEEALRLAEEAAAEHAESGCRLGEARALWQLSTVLAHRGDPGAEEPRQRARELFTGIGAPVPTG